MSKSAEIHKMVRIIIILIAVLIAGLLSAYYFESKYGFSIIHFAWSYIVISGRYIYRMRKSINEKYQKEDTMII